MANLIRKLFLFLFLMLTGTSQGQSQHYRFWAGDIPPYSFMGKTHRAQGDLYEVFQALVARMGYTDKVDIVPWKRAVMDTQKNLPIIFIPVARSPEREHLYQWIEPLIMESFGILSMAAQDLETHDKELLKTLRVCTLRGSITEQLAQRYELARLEIVRDNDTCARLLKAGRVDAWLTGKRSGIASFAHVGYDVKELSIGQQMEQFPLYLAASHALPQEDVQRWRLEIQKMKREGVLPHTLH